MNILFYNIDLFILYTEERYTWVHKAPEAGVYYLLVQPVEAGVNSSNASVLITSVAAQCKFWDATRTNWSDYGCRVRGYVSTDICHLIE